MISANRTVDSIRTIDSTSQHAIHHGHYRRPAKKVLSLRTQTANADSQPSIPHRHCKELTEYTISRKRMACQCWQQMFVDDVIQWRIQDRVHKDCTLQIGPTGLQRGREDAKGRLRLGDSQTSKAPNQCGQFLNTALHKILSELLVSNGPAKVNETPSLRIRTSVPANTSWALSIKCGRTSKTVFMALGW